MNVRVSGARVWICLMVVAMGLTFRSEAVRADSVRDLSAAAVSIQKNVSSLRARYLNVDDYHGKHYAEARLVDGENYYQLKDYQRASIILLDIIENYPSHPAFPEALFYYADSLFLDRDYYGARTEFQKLLDNGEAPAFAPFRAAAISRLVEVAIHLNDFSNVAAYINLLGNELNAQARYVKGKYFYFQRQYDNARTEFAAVKDNQELELKAAYFIGAAYVKEQRIDDAVTAFAESLSRFSAVAEASPDLMDLLYLANGRVLYETDQMESAVDAYGHIDKYSAYYDVALYESASVHMRAGNTVGAERLLEVLTLAIPDSRYIPKAKLLRGHLLSSAARYDDAEKVFEQTITEFSPVLEMMDTALAQSGSSGEFFDLLMARSVDALDVESVIPKEVVLWAGEEPEVKRAFVLTEDLGRAGENTVDSARLATLIGAVVNGTHPVNAIPMLRTAMRQTYQYRNQLAQLAVRLMVEIEDDSDNSGVKKWMSERARLGNKVSALPKSERAYEQREQRAKRVYTELRLELARYETMLDKLSAVMVGLERYISKPAYKADVPAEILEGYWSQIHRYRAGVETVRTEIARVKIDIEKASYQIGIGGEQDVQDGNVTRKIFSLLSKYARYIPSSGRKADDMRNAAKQILAARTRIDKLSAAIERQAVQKVDEIRVVLSHEEEKLARYQVQLEALHAEAKDVVNGVAKENFSGIRERFHDLLLKADVGIIDLAWMKKEEHKNKAVQLSKRRMDDIQWLDEEFKEVDGFSGADEK